MIGVFSTRAVSRGYKKENWGCRVSSVRESRRKPPFREDLGAEAEKYSLLEVINRKRLVKTQQAGTCVAGAVVLCELTVAL
jgi:hypothetical protein